MEEENMLCHK